VVVPGIAGGMGLLSPLIRELSRSFQVFTYHLRGEDDCFALRQRFGITDLAADLHEFVDHLGLERPAILGVSLGGAIALELALAHPWRIGSLAVQGIGPRFEAGLLQEMTGRVLSAYPLPPDSPFFNQFFNLFFGGKQRPGPLVDFIVRQCWQTDQGVMAHRFRLFEKLDFSERLKKIRTKSLIMAGDRDLLVSVASLREMARLMPHSRAVQLPGCGHLAFVTHPERVAAEMAAFLDL
jgi:pimeloyl-ACP methyl ester carboxylesterase